MKTYNRVPPVFYAEQWDGTIEGFEIIRDVLMKSKHTVSWHVQSRTLDVQEDKAPSCFVRLEVGRERYPVLEMGDYVVVNGETGDVEILSSIQFNKLYKETE